MQDRKNDPTERDGKRQLEDQGAARSGEVRDRISRGLTGSVNPRVKDLSDAINEYYHLRERAIQATGTGLRMPCGNLLHTFENMDVEYAKIFSQAANRSGEHGFLSATICNPLLLQG